MVKRLPNGNLLIPKRAESEDGSIVGDAWFEIGPDHPDYQNWLKDAERKVLYKRKMRNKAGWK